MASNLSQFCVQTECKGKSADIFAGSTYSGHFSPHEYEFRSNGRKKTLSESTRQ